jgi:hypothetical protein
MGLLLFEFVMQAKIQYSVRFQVLTGELLTV